MALQNSLLPVEPPPNQYIPPALPGDLATKTSAGSGTPSTTARRPTPGPCTPPPGVQSRPGRNPAAFSPFARFEHWSFGPNYFDDVT